MPDLTLKCSDCQVPFNVSEDEQQWYGKKGWQVPKRCKECRDKRKAQKQEKANA